MVEALLVSTLVVALCEVGDKTQLLALLLAARYRKPWPVVVGVLAATFLNHTLAAAVGNWIRVVVDAEMLKWVLGATFFALAAWALKPDRLDPSDAPPSTPLGVLLTTMVAFFLAEMADKTQIATIALAARYDALAAVIVGSTLGMMIAIVPIVLAGQRAAKRIPFDPIRYLAAAAFAALGAYTLIAGVPRIAG